MGGGYLINLMVIQAVPVYSTFQIKNKKSGLGEIEECVLYFLFVTLDNVKNRVQVFWFLQVLIFFFFFLKSNKLTQTTRITNELIPHVQKPCDKRETPLHSIPFSEAECFNPVVLPVFVA